MAFLPKKTITNQQPQYPAGIDWGNPITRGLVLAVNGATGGINHATGRMPSFVGTQAQGAYREGKSLVFLENPSHRFEYPAAASVEYTFLSVASQFSQVQNASLLGAFSKNQPASNGHYISVEGTPRRAFSVSAQNSAFQTVSGTATILTNRAYVFAGSFGAFGRRVYTDGVMVGSSAAASSPVGLDTFILGSFFDDTNNSFLSNLNGYQPIALAWNRALTDAEIRSISANPWQVFL